MPDIQQVPEFDKDLKKLTKKYRSLPEDLAIFLKAMTAGFPEPLPGTVRISGLGSQVTIPVYKVRHFRCKTLLGKGSRSGIRVIYAHHRVDGADKVLFIEIYCKSDRENEDRARIFQYLQGKSSLEG